MTEINAVFGDREAMEDLLASQVQMTGAYNGAADGCASSGLQAEFLTLLGEEQQIRMEIFQEMQKRGWKAPGKASPEEIGTVKERFSGTDS